MAGVGLFMHAHAMWQLTWQAQIKVQESRRGACATKVESRHNEQLNNDGAPDQSVDGTNCGEQ